MLKHPEVKSLFGNSKGLTFVSTGVVNAVNGVCPPRALLMINRSSSRHNQRRR